jgi:hypothetical protein
MLHRPWKDHQLVIDSPFIYRDLFTQRTSVAVQTRFVDFISRRSFKQQVYESIPVGRYDIYAYTSAFVPNINYAEILWDIMDEEQRTILNLCVEMFERKLTAEGWV